MKLTSRERLMRIFKNEDIELNIIVSSTDDGGHTGKIRDEFASVLCNP